MLGRGWLEEVASLVHSGIALGTKPFDFIGLGESRSHLEGTVTFAPAAKRFVARYLRSSVGA